jgi:hypothetical protein
MNTVESLALVIAEQARKIAELEAFIASKMVVSIAVTKPAEAGLGSIAAAHPDVPVREGGMRNADEERYYFNEKPVPGAISMPTVHKSFADDKPINSVGEINLSWSVTNR